MPLFSIIIPTYNRSALLKELLKGFMHQTFGDFEIIVVDDGGNDDTEEMVKEFKDERLQYLKKKNGGVSSARNYGIEKAQGTYINFFDSDDRVYPNHLEEAYRFFKSRPDDRLVIFNYDWGDLKSRNFKRVFNAYKRPNEMILRENFISINSIFMSKSLLKGLRFAEGLHISEDWLLWIQLSKLAPFAMKHVATSYVVEHEKRGLNTVNLPQLIVQQNLFINNLKEKQDFLRLSPRQEAVLLAHTYSFIALNAALVGEKRTSIEYLFKSVKAHPMGVFKKRTLAIIKHLILS